MRNSIGAWLALCMLLVGAPWLAARADGLPEVWPEVSARDQPGTAVRFPSSSPFVITEAGPDAESTEAHGTLFMPDGASAAAPVPAVIMLHGSGGVREARELTYGRQLASMGVAALVIDAFAARRDKWSNFVERLLNVTETMMMADAFAGFDHLARRPEIDANRIVLMGFSYGAMATTYAAFETVGSRLAPDGRRFAGHIAFYGPCIARFADKTTSGAPLLMLVGRQDAIIDVERCAEVTADLTDGGSKAELIVYDDAYHQWDGSPGRDWLAPRGLKDCRFTVAADGTIRDGGTWLPMTGYYARGLVLSLCSDKAGYRIKGDPAVRARSNAAVARFLNELWWPDAAASQPRGGGTG